MKHVKSTPPNHLLEDIFKLPSKTPGSHSPQNPHNNSKHLLSSHLRAYLSHSISGVLITTNSSLAFSFLDPIIHPFPWLGVQANYLLSNSSQGVGMERVRRQRFSEVAAEAPEDHSCHKNAHTFDRGADRFPAGDCYYLRGVPSQGSSVDGIRLENGFEPGYAWICWCRGRRGRASCE